MRSHQFEFKNVCCPTCDNALHVCVTYAQEQEHATLITQTRVGTINRPTSIASDLCTVSKQQLHFWSVLDAKMLNPKKTVVIETTHGLVLLHAGQGPAKNELGWQKVDCTEKRTHHADVWKHPAWATERTAWRSKAMTWISCQLEILGKNVKTKHNGRVFVASKKQNRFLPPSNAGSLETWQDLLILLVLSWVCCKSPSSKPNGRTGGFHQSSYTLKHLLNNM